MPDPLLPATARRLRTPRYLPSLLAAGVLLCQAAGLAAADAVPTSPVYYQLLLDGGLFTGGEPANGRELVLDLEEVGGRWSAIYGLSRNYNMAFHKGAVKDAQVSGDQLTLKIGMEITPDKWVPGGQGEYTVSLRRGSDGSFTGTHSGSYNGVKRSGSARARVYAPARDADFAALAPQEHPRLLLRRSDLPALREKAKTPFGQAAIKRMEDAATPTSLGFLYQLTGDKAWAVKAEAEAELYLNGKKPEGSPFVPMMANWGRLEQLAVVYDLCYDALSPAYKARYRGWIANLCFQVYFAPESMGTNINWHVVSNHTANVYSGITLSALTLFDEPAAPPAEPVAHFLDETLPPAQGFSPGEGVPVVPLTPGRSPTAWLQSEPVRQVARQDPRECFYGLEQVEARPGTQVGVGDFQLTFAKMPDENRSTSEVGGLKVGHFLEAGASAKLKEPLTMAIYTVIEVKEPGQYVFSCPVSRANLAQSSLAGRLLADKQVVRLEKGLYPLMTMVQWRMKWDEIAPSLRLATPADVEAWKPLAQQLLTQHQTRLQGHAAVIEAWKRSAGGDPIFARMLRLARFTSVLHCSDAVGKGGFQGESGHYSIDACYGHARLWPVYHRVMGYDLTPDREYPDYLPRKIVGGPQDITGSTDIGDGVFPALFPTLREEWKPEMLGAWQRQMKVADPALPVEVLRDDPVRAFISYPLGMKPAPLGSALPLAWDAPGLGWYALRSGWGDDAFVAQVFLKEQIISGWNGENAGTYRLRGLGQDWACGVTDRYRTRLQESVVCLPEADLADGARGHLTHLQHDARTMVLSINLDEVYETNQRYWFSKFGQMRTLVVPTKDKDGKLKEVPPASGITGMRSLAFDFSGESGAPCLFAIVDRIDGGAGMKRSWLFQPSSYERGATAAVKAIDQGFLMTGKADASLRGLFAYPPAVQVSTEPLTWEYVKTVGIKRGEKVTKIINCVSARGDDHFFFVGLVGPGKLPEVAVSGKGLDAVVTVGRRSVSFDGRKLVLGLRP